MTDTQERLYLADLIKAAQNALQEDYLDHMSDEDLRDFFEDDQPHDIIHEIADSWTPIYCGEILKYAVNNLRLAIDAPELGPAFDGEPTPTNIIAANIFEALEAGVWEKYHELKTDAGF